MTKSGYTLIELVVTISIISILTTLGTLQFSHYVRKNAVESQTRELYADIMELRSRALFEKRIGAIKLEKNSYFYFIYPTDDTSGTRYEKKKLAVPVDFNNSSDIVFTTRGVLDGVNNKTICADETNAAPVDTIVLSSTRAQLGKREEGATCAAKNIVAK